MQDEGKNPSILDLIILEENMHVLSNIYLFFTLLVYPFKSLHVETIV